MLEPVHLITGVSLVDGTVVDVTVVEGVVTAVRESTTVGDLHLPGWLLLSAATEPHAHLDKAFSWGHVPQRYGDLRSAIDSWLSYAGTMTAGDIHRRARHALEQYLAHGITTIRTHVDVLPGPDPLRGVEALLALREETRDLLDLQIALLTREDSSDSLVIEAAQLGIDLIGGAPHLWRDPEADTTRLLDLAEQLGLPVDLHTDEQLGAHVLSLAHLCRQVRQRGLAGRVTASHCVSLGSLPPEPLARTVREIRAAGVGIITLPITNLYLQGRDYPAPRPRGLPALQALLDAGVDLAAGGDNIRDPFNPMGRADPFETTSLLITAGHLDAHSALAAVTSGGRAVLGLPPAGPTVGARANFVAVQAASLADALAGPGDARIVVHNGRIVSRTTVDRRTALTPYPEPTVRPA
ncbi:amidohydrolase family protein [Amycolatopsis rhizosphaerae]|uniref:Amidohydrolase family protein n=1 Tax=Amycolatopsis rhizosphaerae TaxID=2053003 RepID=A0A558DPF9_9PSEU|nr:amidohydrolase family protein [Amycolatopsis rhizosphaerae]TVT62886.1 amidohydrolase family protein [Amycolatopsis rhizosphaerae]